jgi:hypothetical protein
VFNNALRVISCLGHASKIRRVLPANYIIGKFDPHLLVSGIESIPLYITLFTILYNMSATNDNGDRGSPCFTPPLTMKDFSWDTI